MIVTSYEAQALMGWAAVLALRIVEMIEDSEQGDPITVETVLQSGKTEGLFDMSKGMTPQTRQSVTIVIQAIADIKPNLLIETKMDGVSHYAVA